MEKDIVLKDNKLIESNIYSKLAHLKLFSRVVLEAVKNPNEEFYDIKIKDIIKDFWVKWNNYEYIREVCKSMMIIDKWEGELFDLKVIFEISLVDRNTLRFKIMDSFKPYILNLTSKYTKYYFKNIVNLNSSYSIRIYEILKQYEKITRREEKIETIKNFLWIKNKYKLYWHFKAKVLLVAQKELKEKTDIYFNFNEIKVGKKVVAIRFSIFSNIKNEITDLIKTNIFLSNLYSFWFSNKEIQGFVDLYKIDRIERSVKYVLYMKKKNNEIIEKSYFYSTVSNDYWKQLSLKVLEEENKKKLINKQKEEEKKEIIITEENKKIKIKNRLIQEKSFLEKEKEEKERILDLFYNIKIKWGLMDKYWKWVNINNVFENKNIAFIFRLYLEENWFC